MKENFATETIEIQAQESKSAIDNLLRVIYAYALYSECSSSWRIYIVPNLRMSLKVCTWSQKQTDTWPLLGYLMRDDL